MDLVSWLPTWAEFMQALPAVLAVVFIDSILSVDNGAIIASEVSVLKGAERERALRYGMFGAYVLRVIALFGAVIIMQNEWIKLLGGAYLVYITCHHLGLTPEEDKEEKAHPSFMAVVLSITMTNLAFSIDNVVAAVQISPKMWVAVVGVTASMIAMYFITELFIKLIEKFPILDSLAYVLVGIVGLSIFVEYFMHIHLSEMFKAGTIAAVVVLGLIYDRAKFLHPICAPVFKVIAKLMHGIAWLVDTILVLPLKSLWSALKSVFGYK